MKLSYTDDLEEYSFEKLEEERKKQERKEVSDRVDEIARLNAMPFYLRIQDKTQIKQLQEFEERQKETFLTHSVPKWKIPKEEGLELFQEFFTEFLRGEVKSIYDFLTGRGYKKYD